MQDSLKVENTPTQHHRVHNASGTTQGSFLAKFKATQNKLGQKRHHYSVYMVYMEHCQRSSPSRISDMPRAGFEPAQNLSSGFVE